MGRRRSAKPKKELVRFQHYAPIYMQIEIREDLLDRLRKLDKEFVIGFSLDEYGITEYVNDLLEREIDNDFGASEEMMEER
jgi:hypothetical protein